MANVLAIVCISSSYAGLFRETGFLDGPRRQAQRLCGRRGAFAGVLVSAVLTSLVACNQTLNIMLTHQLCQGAVEDRERLALALENTARGALTADSLVHCLRRSAGGGLSAAGVCADGLLPIPAASLEFGRGA